MLLKYKPTKTECRAMGCVTFIVKEAVVGEDKPPPLPQLQTCAVLHVGKWIMG